MLSKPCILAPTTPGHKYSRFTKNGKQHLTHRVVLEEKLGRPIRAGFESCHKCDVPNCIEPEHLYEGTRSQNLGDAYARGRRTDGWGNSEKTHCPKGHPYDEDNTYTYGLNKRRCRICNRMSAKKYRKVKKNASKIG